MKITRKLERDGTIGPPALNYLAGISEQNLFFRQQQLRHPASLYEISLEKLGEAFSMVADEYAKDTDRFNTRPSGIFDIKTLLRAQENLLRSLQEHLADCYLILKTLVDPDKTNGKAVYADQYVIDAKLPGAKAFMQASVGYKTSLNIANKIKHNQGRLHGVGVYPGEGVCLGYFLAEPDKAGVIAPSIEIHPNRGAFSFARDLEWRFFLVYLLSENLVITVQRALLGLHQVHLHRSSPPKRPTGDWGHLAEKISKIPRAYFPKELEASVATVQVAGHQQELTIKFPDRARIVYPSAGMRAVVSTSVDGFSPSFKVPIP